MIDFIYPHNSYLFSGIPKIYVAADKNKINNPVLLLHLPTRIFTLQKTICKQTLLISLFALYKLRNTCN